MNLIRRWIDGWRMAGPAAIAQRTGRPWKHSSTSATATAAATTTATATATTSPKKTNCVSIQPEQPQRARRKLGKTR